MTELKRTYKEFIMNGSNFMFDGKFYLKKDTDEEFSEVDIQELDEYKKIINKEEIKKK